MRSRATSHRTSGLHSHWPKKPSCKVITIATAYVQDNHSSFLPLGLVALVGSNLQLETASCEAPFLLDLIPIAMGYCLLCCARCV